MKSKVEQEIIEIAERLRSKGMAMPLSVEEINAFPAITYDELISMPGDYSIISSFFFQKDIFDCPAPL